MKGHKLCPACEEKTFFIQLKHKRKTIYLDTRLFLTTFHHYRRVQKAFDGYIEEGKAPKPLNVEHVYQWVKHLVTPRSDGYGNVTATYIRRSEIPSRIYAKYQYR